MEQDCPVCWGGGTVRVGDKVVDCEHCGGEGTIIVEDD